jgi:putative component of toxin-antitoxin plasmid stabilization module
MLDAREQARFRALLERLCSVGFLRAPEDMRRLEVAGDPSVSEVKVHSGPGYRLYLVPEHRRWIATHGCKKPKDKLVARQVTKSRKMYRGE